MTAVAPIIHLTMGRGSPLATEDCVEVLDLYELANADLLKARGLLIGMGVDEIYLSRHQSLLDCFVRNGGVIALCAQVARPYLTGLVRFAPISHHRPSDLAIHRLHSHPVWEGVHDADLSMRKGVAGFYGRGCYRELPEDAIIVNTVGPDFLPLDFIYPLGNGEVLVHGGNDLWSYRDDPNTSARLTPQLLRWILDRHDV